MTIFYLPDLGEGLAEAVIHEWHVKVGDKIKTDELMLSVETAKALVDIPAPFTGMIKELFAQDGETCKTGAPLCEIENENAAEKTAAETATVAGKLATGEICLAPETAFSATKSSGAGTSAKRLLPKDRLSARQNKACSNSAAAAWHPEATPLTGVRLSMAHNMARAHQEVAQASIFDEADISKILSSANKPDFTALLIQAIAHASQAEPALNAWYDGDRQLRLAHSAVHLALAVDTPEGLYVPVIKHAEKCSAQELREKINGFKTGLLEKTLSPDAFQGGTITLSNIGQFAGRFATPIVLPPTVAIIAAGRINRTSGTLPISLSFDHRAVTGGEAARFLATLLKFIEHSG